MTKDKKIEYTVSRGEPEGFHIWFANDRESFCILLPVAEYFFGDIVKGLRPGQNRKLILTQTKNGIKLERAEKLEVKP